MWDNGVSQGKDAVSKRILTQRFRPRRTTYPTFTTLVESASAPGERRLKA